MRDVEAVSPKGSETSQESLLEYALPESSAHGGVFNRGSDEQAPCRGTRSSDTKRKLYGSNQPPGVVALGSFAHTTSNTLYIT